jgi:hypothetical protein
MVLKSGVWHKMINGLRAFGQSSSYLALHTTVTRKIIR